MPASELQMHIKAKFKSNKKRKNGLQKNQNAPTNTVTRDMMKLSEETGNVYETVAIISNGRIRLVLR